MAGDQGAGSEPQAKIAYFSQWPAWRSSLEYRPAEGCCASRLTPRASESERTVMAGRPSLRGCPVAAGLSLLQFLWQFVYFVVLSVMFILLLARSRIASLA